MICSCCAHREPYEDQVCGPCRWRLRTYLREIPELYATLNLTYSSGAAGPVVSGTRERQLPLNVAALDLTLAARHGTVSDLYGDQTGELSVATVLDTWVQDWIEHRFQRESRPVPTVAVLAGWLYDRLDDACADHPAMDAFYVEMGRLVVVLRNVQGITSAKTDVKYKVGVPCRSCDMLALYQANGSDWIECGSCPELLSSDEYARWVRSLNEVEDAA